jgi:hypothetical protein
VIRRRSKVAGRSEVSSRDTAGTVRPLSVDSIAKSSQTYSEATDVDLLRNGPDSVRALLHVPGSVGLQADERLLSSCWRPLRSRSVTSRNARAAPEALSRRPVHSERPTEHRHQSRRARSQPSDAAEHRLPRNDRDSSRALLPLRRARGCTSTRGSSRQARACRAHGWLIGTGRNSRAPLKPRHGGPATQRERVIRGVVRRFRCSLWQPRFRTSFGCGWRRRSRFGRRSLRTRPSRGGRAPGCEEWRALPFSLESTPPLVSARSSSASMTGVRRSCGSRAF